MLNRDFDALARRKLARSLPRKTKKGNRLAQRTHLPHGEQRRVPRGLRHGAGQVRGSGDASCSARSTGWRSAWRNANGFAASDFTEADVRLFTTLVRFDAVYYSHFKCNLRRLVDYPNLWRWTRRVYALPGVAKTVDMAQIKAHYYRSMKQINPTQIVPKGPLLDFRCASCIQCLCHERTPRRGARARARPASASPCASSPRPTAAPTRLGPAAAVPLRQRATSTCSRTASG